MGKASGEIEQEPYPRRHANFLEKQGENGVVPGGAALKHTAERKISEFRGG